MTCSAFSFGSARSSASSARVLGGVPAAPARPGDGAERHLAVLELDERLGGAAHQRPVAVLQVEQVGRRVHPAQRPVDVERRRRSPRRRSAARAQSAGSRRPARTPWRGARRPRRRRDRRAARARRACRRGRARPLARAGARASRSVASMRASAARVERARVVALVAAGLGDDVQRVAQVVEGDHQVVVHEAGVGEAELVRRSRSGPAARRAGPRRRRASPPGHRRSAACPRRGPPVCEARSRRSAATGSPGSPSFQVSDALRAARRGS